MSKDDKKKTTATDKKYTCLMSLSVCLLFTKMFSLLSSPPYTKFQNRTLPSGDAVTTSLLSDWITMPRDNPFHPWG